MSIPELLALGAELELSPIVEERKPKAKQSVQPASRNPKTGNTFHPKPEVSAWWSSQWVKLFGATSQLSHPPRLTITFGSGRSQATHLIARTTICPDARQEKQSAQLLTLNVNHQFGVLNSGCSVEAPREITIEKSHAAYQKGLF